MMTAARITVFSVSLVSLMAGCASAPPAGERAEPEPVAVIAPANEPVVAEDRATATQVGPTAEEMAAAELPPVEAPEIQPVAASTPSAPVLAELGRPGWWFDGVVKSDRVIRICAEAGGATVREARRAAIEAARRRLALEVEIDPMRENVSLATVLPLPAADAGPGAARYIGYVMMEVPAS